MIYVIFAVLLVVSNLLTFRFTGKYIANVIVKDVKAFSDEYVSYRPSKNNAVDEYIIHDRRNAQDVLTTLNECADKYGMVSLADYHNLIKVSSNLTDHSYGWTQDSVTSARIVSVRDGYVIKFPPVESL